MEPITPRISEKPVLVLKEKPVLVLKEKKKKAAAIPPPPEPKPIQLLPSQVPHVERLVSILKSSVFCLDHSCLGSGKTYAAGYIATQAGFGFSRVAVIAPVSVKSRWQKVKQEHDIPLSHNLSYCEIKSSKCKQPKHQLLHRRDYQVTYNYNGEEQPVDKVEFSATDKFKDMLREGVLLVVDEYQNIKNISAQFAAVQALIKALVELYEQDPQACKSRLIMISGSPIDKRQQAVHLFRTLHIQRHDMLASFNLQRYEHEWRGMQDIEDYCISLDATAVNNIIQNQFNGRVQDSKLEEYAYALFQNVVKPHLSSAMPPPPCPFQLRKANAYYQVHDPQEHYQLTAAIQRLARVLGFNERSGTVTFAHTSAHGRTIHALTKILLQIETAKTGTFARVAREVLTTQPKTKVVICVNYTSTLKDLKALLADFDPLILNGTVSDKRRGSIINKFQEPSTTHRLLIGNVSVCSTGIDLDDKHGDYPRFALVSPNYHTIHLYQLGHRFQRADTKSDADVRFLFGAHAFETKVLHALAKKSTVMRETTQEQANHGVVFPGDFESWYEVPPSHLAQAPAQAQAPAPRPSRRRDETEY